VLFTIVGLGIIVYFALATIFPMRCNGCGHVIKKEEIEKIPTSGWRRGGASGSAAPHKHYICPHCAKSLKL